MHKNIFLVCLLHALTHSYWRRATQRNDIQKNDTYLIGTKYNDTQDNDAQHIDTQHNGVQYTGTQHNKTQPLSKKMFCWVSGFSPVCRVSFC